MLKALFLLLLAAYPAEAQTVIDPVPGGAKFTPVCEKGPVEPNTSIGFAGTVLDAISYGHDAAARIDTLPDIAAAAPDDKARMAAMGKTVIAAYNDYLCGEMAMLPFNKKSPDEETLIAASAMFLSLRQQMRAFTHVLETVDKSHIADALPALRAERDKIWQSTGPVVQIALLTLKDVSRKDKDGKQIAALLMTGAEKRKMLQRIERDFPGLKPGTENQSDYPSGFAALYLAILGEARASDE